MAAGSAEGGREPALHGLAAASLPPAATGGGRYNTNESGITKAALAIAARLRRLCPFERSGMFRLEQQGHQAGPAGLVRCARPLAVVAAEVFVELRESSLE